MPSFVVILGPTVTSAVRAAVSLAARRCVSGWAACCAGVATRRYAAAAGAELIDTVDHIDVAVVAFDDEQAAAVAETHNAALVLDVITIISAFPLRIARDLGHGEKEIMDISGPAVLAISDEAPNELYISHHRLASVPPVRLIEGHDQNKREGESPYLWQPVRIRTRTPNLAERTAGTATHRAHTLFGVGDTIEDVTGHLVRTDCAQHLMRYLSHYGFIDNQVLTDLAASSPSAPALMADDTTASPGVSLRTARGPRPITAEVRDLNRRPVPSSPARHHVRKLARAPRPIATPPLPTDRSSLPRGEQDG
jgi:hypothetical protein